MTATVETRDRICELVRAAQAGDRQAFGDLFERFYDHVYAVALRRLRNHNDALELCQDVFLQAMQKIAQLRDPHCFGGWIRSITQRMAINRSLRRSPDVLAQPEVMEAACVEAVTPLTNLLAGERRDEVRGTRPAWRTGSRHPGSVLRSRGFAVGDEPRVRRAAGNHQATLARRPQATGGLSSWFVIVVTRPLPVGGRLAAHCHFLISPRD